MLSVSPVNATKKREARSAVSNGTRLFDLDAIDGRSREARRYRDVLSDLVTHLAGDPTAPETIIARRAASLTVWCESREAEMVAGQDIDIAAFTTATNALRRLLVDIGLERRAKDVTPSLSRYLEGRAPR